ncbi:DNA-directed RNA polymerases IV and V subunit 4-like isoform X1 [Cucurbita maxima]|uniref:DNA-directed RNA polymerases IV and V subunit 4-like isoform X1 n=1 Tax=Cucurbita maxima TaxID=3661 RepID=A0A6J1IMM9_CUCMA|nr:DNA-directed RNA polymerases IV and V subunit 4-like isoform X1 [Cucurbita maxima]XP_022979018.1 DNA-directed RNA polymerases IV and V subunit 4-like isoform X1 [Cucurbita maxima]XP_022979019.1 DNA-directed RNA polymerases IV and V subunit 4-like isoform X1 [Cucurbita maxima]XP_022979020.1 DNA-directed RNA polymerases IV and V subunit 4-like isoform X1 [Cucurbita maxima]XP_022979021.1 DNA-directed RNA polymerases IV and V subunit 4-like isoform X1 [Cucurbita maxima]
MSEKGEKGSPLPKKPGKSSLKSSSFKDASLKGKDDSLLKPKKGRKVQFDAQGSVDAQINFSMKYSGKNGELGKGGKGGSGAKEPQPLELKIEQELPKNVKCQCLMDCEAAQILQGIQDQMVLLSADPTIKIPTSFDRGLQYAKRANHYVNTESVRPVLKTLKKYGVMDSEVCVLANVCPDTPDEVFALLPSLKSKRSKLSEPLNNVLSELAKVKSS